jgi:hypothetical protein
MSETKNHDSEIVFYIHNHKCGGHSIYKALEQSGQHFTWTGEIFVDAEDDLCQQVLQNKPAEKLLIFGHPDKINFSSDSEKTARFVNALYSHARIILPSRRPISVLISWLEYIRTRLIKSFINGAHVENDTKLNSFLDIWLEYSGNSLEFHIKNGFPHPHISARKNLENWIEVSTSRARYHWLQTANLFFPQSGDIKIAIDAKITVNLPLEKMIKNKKLFIYCADTFSQPAQTQLAMEFGEEFVNAMRSLRLNASIPSIHRLDYVELVDLERKLASVTDLDSQIYQFAV